MFNTPDGPVSGWTELQLLEQSIKRIDYVKIIMPSSAISLLTVKQRISYFEDYIATNYLPESQEKIALNILYSFYSSAEDGEEFLKFLIKNDGKATNFEKLFGLFDDRRANYFSEIYNFFVQGADNRRNFIIGIYKIWERSNFNFNYIPAGVTPDNLGLNPNSFFYTDEGKIYFQSNGDKIQNIALEFGTVWQGTGTGTGNDGLTTIPSIEKKYFPPKLELKTVTSSWQFIDVTKTINSNQEVTDVSTSVSMNSIFPKEIVFHLFQPITLVGYKPEEELEPIFPQKPFVPAFVWYYAQEFERLKNVDSTIDFATDIAVEVGLFFLTGGVSTLAELRYLRYVSDIAKAIRAGGTGAEYTVLILKGLGSIGQTVSVSSAVCERYYNLLVQLDNQNNASEIKKHERLHKFFLNLTLISAGATVALEYGVRKYARSIFQDTAYFNSIDPKIQNLIGEIVGQETAILNTFRDGKLTNKPKILAKFDSPDWSIIKRKKFYEDFKGLDEADLLKLNDDIALANWEKLLNNSIDDRLIISIISNNTKSNSIVRYYEQYRFRQKLSNYKVDARWWFLDRHGITDNAYFQNLTTNPVAIDLHLITRQRPNGATHLMQDFQVKEFVRHNNDPIQTEYLYELQKPINWKQLKTQYLQKINVEDITASELLELSERFVSELPTDKLKKLYKSSNRLFTKQLKIEKNGTLVEDMNTSNINFISGKSSNINNKLLNNSVVPASFKNRFINLSTAQQQKAYEVFSDAAFDGLNLRPRTNDTEIKFMVWFITEQWSRGNRFTIELESVLYSCPSCQRHLMMLEEYGRKNGKIINIKFRSHPDAKEIKHLNEIL